MKYAGRLAAVAVVGALSLAACGTDNNSARDATASAGASTAAGNDNGLAARSTPPAPRPRPTP